MIKVSKHVIDNINKLLKEKRKYKNKCGKEPTTIELASILNTTNEKIIELENLIKDKEPVCEEIKSFNVKDLPKEEYYELVKKIEENKCLLNEKEQEILLLTFGLIDNRFYSTTELAKKYNITTERVRQIVAKGIRKVRNPKKKPKLKDFIEED